jgi:hypothetical protein
MMAIDNEFYPLSTSFEEIEKMKEVPDSMLMKGIMDDINILLQNRLTEQDVEIFNVVDNIIVSSAGYFVLKTRKGLDNETNNSDLCNGIKL